MLQKLGRVLSVLSTLLGVNAVGQEMPADYAELSIESGYLVKVKNNSPYEYRIVPTQFVWHSPVAFEMWRSEGGTQLIFRHRLALLTETLYGGPESYYFGISGAPSIELWLPNKKAAFFSSVGGGLGYINAKDVVGGQGQNLTLNFFAQFGLRHQLSNKMALSGALYFLHHSNGGMTNPNPGIDTLGINFGLIWRAY